MRFATLATRLVVSAARDIHVGIMAYNTRFDGSFSITPAVRGATLQALHAVCTQCHGHPTDAHVAAADAPSLYCAWEISPDGAELRPNALTSASWWPWLERLTQRDLSGHTLTGAIYWHGDDPADQGLVECDASGLRFRAAGSDPGRARLADQATRIGVSC